MYLKLLKSTELRQLASFVSPAFFDVLPARKIWGGARTLLVSDSSAAYLDAVTARARSLEAMPLAVSLPGTEAVRDDLGSDASAHATRIVTLYFGQLFSDSPTLLDLRKASARDLGGRVEWRPAAWVCRWSADFIRPLRGLYEGFYKPDDVLLEQSLRELRLEIAGDLFRQHFGAHPEAHRFVLRDFIKTFHSVFVRCRGRVVSCTRTFCPSVSTSPRCTSTSTRSGSRSTCGSATRAQR